MVGVTGFEPATYTSRKDKEVTEDNELEDHEET